MPGTRDAVLQEIEPLAKRFVDAGHRLYLVGGIVRDLQLGARLDDLDFDLTTDARPPEIKRLVGPIASAVWTQGERFGTIGCRIGDRPIEITTHRAEWYGSDSRKPGVEFGEDIVADLSRRDFTVNAMAIELPAGELVDPFEGSAALAELRLETPIDPDVSFGDDPLRILRAARFIARYGLVPVAGLVSAAQTLIGRLAIVSAERIREEYDKLLAAPRPAAGLAFLDAVGALPQMFPALPPQVIGDLGTALDASPVDVVLRRALTFSHLPPGTRAEQLSSLRYSNQEQRLMTALLDGSDLIAGGTASSDELVRRLVLDVGLDQMDRLFSLVELRGGDAAAWRARFAALAAAEDLDDLAPATTGGRIIAELGLEGPAVGQAVAALRERRLMEGPATEAEELDWLRARS